MERRHEVCSSPCGNGEETRGVLQSLWDDDSMLTRSQPDKAV